MNPEVRRKALKAASQVALVVVGVGCGGLSENQPAPEEGDAEAANPADPVGATAACGGTGALADGSIIATSTDGSRIPAVDAGGGGAGNATPTSGPEPDDAAGGAQPSDDAEQPVLAGDRCSMDASGEPVALSEAVGCCLDFNAPHVTEQSLFADREQALGDADILSCCQIITVHGQFSDSVACCELLDFEPTVCSPWGPPVPPSFPEAAA